MYPARRVFVHTGPQGYHRARRHRHPRRRRHSARIPAPTGRTLRRAVAEVDDDRPVDRESRDDVATRSLAEPSTRSTAVEPRSFETYRRSPAAFLREVRSLGRLASEMLFRLAPSPTSSAGRTWPSSPTSAGPGPPVPKTAAWHVVPDLAVEVISPNDLAVEVLRKLDDYFRAGVRQVWVVYPSTGASSSTLAEASPISTPPTPSTAATSCPGSGSSWPTCSTRRSRPGPERLGLTPRRSRNTG